MSGTVKGGKRASKTNRARYGDNYYRVIGALGGVKSKGGGFSKVPGLAQRAGKIGGTISRRTKNES